MPRNSSFVTDERIKFLLSQISDFLGEKMPPVADSFDSAALEASPPPRRNPRESDNRLAGAEYCPDSPASRLGEDNESFSRYLMSVIAQKKFDYVQVYKGARLDRRLFSKIRSKPKYQPSKKTVLALALSMRLDYCETQSLLAKAGYTLAKNILYDLALEYFINTGNYDFNEINAILDNFGLPVF